MSERKGKKNVPSIATSKKGSGKPSHREASKKPFVAPKLTRHETLPEVTTGFFGTFSP